MMRVGVDCLVEFGFQKIETSVVPKCSPFDVNNHLQQTGYSEIRYRVCNTRKVKVARPETSWKLPREFCSENT